MVVSEIIDSWTREHPGVVQLGAQLHDENYFDSVAKTNIDISEIYNYVIKRFNEQGDKI